MTSESGFDLRRDRTKLATSFAPAKDDRRGSDSSSRHRPIDDPARAEPWSHWSLPTDCGDKANMAMQLPPMLADLWRRVLDHKVGVERDDVDHALRQQLGRERRTPIAPVSRLGGVLRIDNVPLHAEMSCYARSSGVADPDGSLRRQSACLDGLICIGPQYDPRAREPPGDESKSRRDRGNDGQNVGDAPNRQPPVVPHGERLYRASAAMNFRWGAGILSDDSALGLLLSRAC